MHIGILGAGIIGANTALQLQAAFPNAKFTLIADKFNAETLSTGAAGIFRAGSSFCGPSEEITRNWIEYSYNFYNNLLQSTEAERAGVMQVSGYLFSSKYPSIVKVIGMDYSYEEAGGQVIRRRVDSFVDLGDLNFDCVVNCTGFGSKSLCKDSKLVPIRGQVYKVKAPWIKMFYYGDFDTYVIPGRDYVTLGGCRQFDSYNEEVDKYDSASIWDRCTSLVPSLKQSTVVKEWVGLRPHRSSVRCELENINIGTKFLKVIHQYGHGGYGVTSAPGSSKYAVELLQESLRSTQPPPTLNPHAKL